ncbi:MAG: NADH:flavin oxidoreductase [Acidobacteria bacterium]|nr:NADH:flavin oxidoreductase [Acidobacteriota bacterium]
MPKHYFVYQKLEDLREDARRLQIDLPLVDDREEIRSIFARPVEIKSRDGRRWRVGNSFAIHPMEGCDGELDGNPGELTFRRYRRFGSGGAKLIWFEACAVVPEGRANPRQLWIHPGSAKRLEALLKACREAHRQESGASDDLVTVLQLTHSGRYSFEKPRVAYRHPVLDCFPAVNSVTLPLRETAPEVVSDEYLAALEDRFAAAATLAREIGFDGVDLKMTHGYLLSELMSARSRPGIYGGPLENRARFALDVIEKIRQQAGDDYLLAVRLGVFDGIPYGVSGEDSAGVPRAVPRPYEFGFGVDPYDPSRMDLTEPLRFIGWLEKAGVRLLNVSMGIPYVNPHISRPFEKPVEGSYETPEHPLFGVARHFAATAEIQKAHPDFAVVGTGYSWLRHFLIHAGAANLKLHRTTFVGLGRAVLAYPTLPRDALAKGELDPLRTCKTLSYCTYLMRAKSHPLGQFPTGCPPFDKEGYGAIIKQARAVARKPAQEER